MSYRQRRLGLVPSPVDHRDYHLSRITAVKSGFPEKYVVPNLVPVPYDQGDIGACVAFSLKAIKEMQEYRERKAFVKYSAAYIYGARDQDDFKGEGMIPREALDIVRKRGVCTNALFPGIFPYPICARKITAAMDADALPQKIMTYAAIYTVEETKTALMELGPISAGIQVYDSFFPGGHLPKPQTNREQMHGFHMLTIVGWTKDNRWLALNSWGKDWGELKGYCTMAFDYPIVEKWAITDMTPAPKTDYEVIVERGTRFWTVRFTKKYRTEADTRKLLLGPLIEDLRRSGKTLRLKVRR